MPTDQELLKYPRLREDLKISRMVQMEQVTFVVKDPIKQEFFRFDGDEWEVISQFDGSSTLEEIVKKFNSEDHAFEIDLETVKDYKENLEIIMRFLDHRIG